MGTIIQNLSDDLMEIDRDFTNDQISRGEFKNKLKKVARELNRIASFNR